MTPELEFITTGIAIWGAVCILATVGLVFLSPRIGRLRAAAWMITIAAVLLIEEDPILLTFMASNGPAVDRDGVLGIVRAHTRAHMYGGAAWTAGAMFLSVLVAHRWLATGAREAWTALLGVFALGAAGDLFMLAVYPHGLAFLPAPDDGVIGFGWPTLVGGLAIWAFALFYSYGPLFAVHSRRKVQRSLVSDSIAVRGHSAFCCTGLHYNVDRATCRIRSVWSVNQRTAGWHDDNN